MARIRHGEVVSLDQVRAASAEILEINSKLRFASAPARIGSLTSFDYLFPQLQANADALLPIEKSNETVRNLIRLGETMNESGDDPAFDSTIPSAYTYFGQFLNHDITLEAQSDGIVDLDRADLTPLPLNEIRQNIKNGRTPTLDLDSVYGTTSDGWQVPRHCDELLLGPVNLSGGRPKNRGIFNDLKRKPPALDKPEIDREAIIGDARNDENLIISQLHVAFIHAHNALVDRGLTFNEARKSLVQHYQWLVIQDFLMRVADTEIVSKILKYGNGIYRPSLCDLYIPLEFSVAAFRFGHSMVRKSYDYNVNFGKSQATLTRLFDITTFNGLPATVEQIPEAWIIEWKNFLEGPNFARRIDTRLVEPLFQLLGPIGKPMKGVRGSLAITNLLRGYLLRMPVGQAVAAVLGEPALSPEEIDNASANAEQSKVLHKSGFLERTPLWYYILAEAAQRDSLGPVGSTIVAEVLIGVVRWSEHSILSQPGWKPTLGSTPGVFMLPDLFKLGSVWS
jgi:hypothetical protein